MTAREFAILTDDCTKLYVCDSTGIVIGEYDEIPATFKDIKIVNITTYNYGIEIDIDI